MGFTYQWKLAIHALWVVDVGDSLAERLRQRGGEVLFAGEEDGFGAAREVGFVLVGEGRVQRVTTLLPV